MFRSVDRSPRRRNRAVTLIEAVLYISIALALIVGGLVFFQQASAAAKTSAMVRQLSSVVAETRVLIKGLPASAVPVDITTFLISAGAVPQDMVGNATNAVNTFGGEVQIYHQTIDSRSTIMIMVNAVPQGVCSRLLAASKGSDYVVGGFGATTVVSSGLIRSGVRAGLTTMLPDYRPYAMNPTQAGWMCKYGGANYENKTQQPNTTPISGNVAVAMYFLVDA
jgi:hypothetical protein